MDKHFNCIGIIGHISSDSAFRTYKILWHWLTTKGYQVIVEKQIAEKLFLKKKFLGTVEEIGKHSDLAIVVGGDGNMLGAARILSCYDIKVIGINRGNLGFLTDINPDNLQQDLNQVLQGNYFIEKRFLLDAQDRYFTNIGKAMNEIVIHSGKVACMVEFEVYIDEKFVFSQRSDGLIISTPTGSTAYSLSAGGPILTPSIEAISLVPMFPHTLSARPLVISSNSTICLQFTSKRSELEISFDGQISFPIQKNSNIFIKRNKNCLNLIHKKTYNYYNTLSYKLGWSKNMN